MSAYMMEKEKELTIEEVAVRLGISYQTARRRVVKEKVIRARREGLEWRVLESDLQRYIESTFQEGQ